MKKKSLFFVLQIGDHPFEKELHGSCDRTDSDG
jgi:hypothetical protein